jgi:very-short-patch-repair endonuclease
VRGIRRTTEEFINDSIVIHGNVYDYSRVKYINSKTKVIIICKKHGSFEQISGDHLKGCKCPKCSRIKMVTATFVRKSKEIHNNKYDYSKVKYIKIKNKVIIVCKEHGEFEQTAGSHIQGKGCPVCAGVKKSTTIDFIKKAHKVHKNRYNYNLVKYINNKTKVKIICSEHGKFEQRPDVHLKGVGCAMCSGNVMNTEMFIEKSKKTHSDRYEYSLVDYKNYKTKVIIICKKHGKFLQNAYQHMSGSGCRICNESKGERIIKDSLTNKNILFERQKTFIGCKYKRVLPFDFYLKDYNICIEFDGLQHYKPISTWGGEKNFKDIKKRDKIKNEYCKHNGIKLYRIKYNDDIQNNMNKILKENFLC